MAKLLPFRGEHPELVTGHFYTASDYARVSGISASTMATRLHKAYEVNTAHLRPINQDYNNEGERVSRSPKKTADTVKSAFTTPDEKFSGEWLNKRIVK